MPLAAETLLAVGVGPETADVLRSAAFRAIEACHQAAMRRRNLDMQPASVLKLLTEDDLKFLLRQAVREQLMANHGFTGSAATAITDAAFSNASEVGHDKRSAI